MLCNKNDFLHVGISRLGSEPDRPIEVLPDRCYVNGRGSFYHVGGFALQSITSGRVDPEGECEQACSDDRRQYAAIRFRDVS